MTEQQKEFELSSLIEPIHKGANWFYWITGLSLINAVLATANTDVHFIVGLAMSEFAVGIMKVGGLAPMMVGGAALLLIIGFFLFIGKKAHVPNKTFYLVGIILYAIDGLIYLAFQDFLPAAFHIYVLYNLWTGYKVIDNYHYAYNQPTAETTAEVINVEAVEPDITTTAIEEKII